MVLWYIVSEGGYSQLVGKEAQSMPVEEGPVKLKPQFPELPLETGLIYVLSHLTITATQKSRSSNSYGR